MPRFVAQWVTDPMAEFGGKCVGHYEWCSGEGTSGEDKNVNFASAPWLCASYTEECPTPPGGTEVCNGMDDDYDGCVDEGCTEGEPPCECQRSCDPMPTTCPSPRIVATCDLYQDRPEICDGTDNNCNGLVDEGCEVQPPPNPPGPRGGPTPPEPFCQDKAGKDPIYLGVRAAVTAPSTDFSVQHVSALGISRTYSSADASITSGGSPGVFGRGWHHDHEGTLSCKGSVCTVRRGLGEALSFRFATSAASLSGGETWDIYRPAGAGARDPNHGILARRPDGTWILFQADGRELHFATVCDACTSDDLASRRCTDARSGGDARVVKEVDPAGNAITLTYDRPGGVLLGMSDDLGHRLEVRSASACTAGFADELRYDGERMVSYEFSGPDLVRAVDADANTLRSYVYVPGSEGRLWAVQNEAGTAVVQFQYDALLWQATGPLWPATGVVDDASSAAVQYGAGGSVVVTEYFHGPNGDTSAASIRTLDRSGRVTSVSDGCACGTPKMLQWGAAGFACSMDAQGGIEFRDFDAAGRIVRQVQYRGTSCPASGAALPMLGVDARDVRFGYSGDARRQIAQGVTLELDFVSSVSRPVGTRAGLTESYDLNRNRAPIDPPDYSCAPDTLPAAGVVCRRITTGVVQPNPGNALTERHATFLSYDARGRLVRSYGPVNLDLPSPTDVPPLEERTYWPDDASAARRGRLREVRNYPSPTAAPLVTRFDYDAFGVFQTQAPDGSLSIFVKDGRGRTTHVLQGGTTRETRYYDGNEPRLVLYPSGMAVRFSHGALGRVSSIERLSGDPDVAGASPAVGWSEQYTYDAAGNRILTERRDASGRVISRVDRDYDVHHRVVREVNPEAPTLAKTWTFDPVGGLVSTADEEGRGTRFTLDALGRPSVVTRTGPDASGNAAALDVAKYEYQPNSDSLAAVTDGHGQRTDYVYDDFGRLEVLWTAAQMAGSSGRGVRRTHDARGNILTAKENYVTVDYTYDGLDRVLSMTARDTFSAASPPITYQYRYDEGGAVGRLTSIVEASRTVTFQYDGAGRLRAERSSESGASIPLVTQYGYDPDGGLASITYPSGLAVRYERDPATGGVSRVVNAATGKEYARGIARLPEGPVTALTFGNGRTLSQAFSLRQEPLVVESGPLALTYTPSAAGNVAAIVNASTGLPDAGTTRTFQHDLHDRLVSSPGWLSYRHDGAGNRVSQTVAGASATYSYSSQRMAYQLVGGQARLGFGYDLATNVSAIVLYDGSGAATQGMCLRHDPLNRLTYFGRGNPYLMTPGDVSCLQDSDVIWPRTRFHYDARNRRVARQDVSTGKWTQTVFDAGGNPLSELAKTSDPANPWRKVRDYVWLEGRPLAQVEYPGPAGSGEGYAYYFHVDHLGLPRALSNEAGQVVWSASVTPYGEVVETTGTDPLSGTTVVTNLRLPGQYDERLFAAAGISGMQGPYYNWNRWYLPSVGRYMELDPIALAGGFNSEFGVDWYNYAKGNPLRFTDIEGLLAYDACLMRCIENNSWSQYLTALPASAYPKWLLGFRTPEPTQPLTTLPSGIQSVASRWGVPLGRGLREFGRRISPLGTALTITEGFWDIGVIGVCAATCGNDAPETPRTCK